MSNLILSHYFMAPVETVIVTADTVDDVAKWCGGTVGETESRRLKGQMDKYVNVPVANKSGISWAFPGMFITKRIAVTDKNELRESFAIFRSSYFRKNFFELPMEAVEATWGRQMSEHMAELPR